MIKQKIEYRRGLSLLLTFLMCLSMVNLSVFAQEDRPTYCGMEAHTHSIEAGCYKLNCEQEEVEAVEGHQHDDECYTIKTSDAPVCGKEEVEAVEGHKHTDDCYEMVVDVPAHYEGCSHEGEEHTDDCTFVEATYKRGELKTPHEEVEAVEGHHHTDACYQTKVLNCGKEVGEGAVEGHKHSIEAGCYAAEPSCGKTEHTHVESCYKAPECTCETKCTEGNVNSACPVCSADLTNCTGTEPEQEQFTATFDFETGALTVNGSGELTKEIVDSFRFTDEKGTSWMLNIPGVNELGENGTTAGVLNDKVKKVVIGDGITAIGERALGGSGYANANYTGSGSRSLIYVEELVLPEGLLTIGKNAFTMMGQKAASDLFTVNFPSSLERIGEMAFSQCKKLPKELTIAAPEVVIEGSVFWGCTSIETLTIDGAKELKDYAFDGGGFSSNLKSVTMKNVGTVNMGVCSNQPKLTDLTMTNVDEIARLAFWGVSSLETVTLTNVKKIGDQAFYGWYSYDSKYMNLKTLTIDGCDSIGEKAFIYCNNLADVTLNNVKQINGQVFQAAGSADTKMTLTNIGTIGTYAFWYSNVANVTMDNVSTIGQYAFYEANALEAVEMGKVGTISPYAFSNCGKLTAIDSLKNVDRIDGFAFYGCANLSGLTVEDLTKMGFNGNYGDVMDRVQRILAGEFKLDAAPDIADITVGIPEEGWEDGKTAQSDNWETYNNGTQLVEQARWTNTDKTEAEVKVDAYYTAPKQMDYIFVADLSASMAQLGNPEDMNSRFYDMQSKLLDMTDELLTSGEVYDCRVAIVTFGGALDANTPGTSAVMEFTNDAETAMKHINALEPLFENTDYGLGMQKALKLAQDNANAKRNTVVIFLSDGAPNQNGSGDKTGTTAAAAIKALDNPDGTKVPIYGVLHSAPADLNNGDPRYQYHTNAMNAMQAVCSAPTADVPVTVFEATNTKSFGEAMNDAFTAVYPDYTVTVPVNEAFENVREWKVSVSGGEADYDAENHAMIWTITGMPFTKHTLTYSMSLTAENAAKYGEQSYPVNTGNAVIAGGASVETPVLTRTVAEPVVPDPGPDPVTRYTLTINYVYEDGTTAAPTHSSRHDSGYQYSVSSPSIEGYTPDQAVVSGTLTSNVTVTVVYTADANIDDENPPLAENPDENPGVDIEDENPPLAENPEVDIPDEEPPLAENPEVDIPDEDVPLDATPKTGDDSHTGLWAGLCVVSLLGAVALGRKEEDERA